MRGCWPDGRPLGPVAVLAAGLLMATAAPAAAQEGEAQAVPDLAALEAMCEANAADEDAERLCLRVVRQVMLPTTDPDPEAAETLPAAEPEPVVYGLGDAQERHGVRSKPIKVKWNAPPMTVSWDKPHKGMMYVDLFVQHKAGEEGGRYWDSGWKARDRKGFTYGNFNLGKSSPNLLTGDLKPGQTVRGWVTFEVPRKTRWLEILYEPLQFDVPDEAREPSYWTVEKKKGK